MLLKFCYDAFFDPIDPIKVYYVVGRELGKETPPSEAADCP